ncbi:MAG: helicase-exonuclease AddAB subunit AddA [Lachnospiraceae bacterium]|nr:helicase-exonuclease AddAB subunit AddA [Lachnospiraceae bacterium]
MAEFELNDAQKKAVSLSGSNILVSAAAGSGKTAVLVERVLKMVLEDQVDMDSLIIMTFTKAAAASMKEKIYKRIREVILDEKTDESIRTRLRMQQMKIHSARICTIDSLCLEIVKEHFQDIDLDPGFRIADEAENKLLMNDVLQEMLEEHYSDPDEAFLTFVSYYTDKNDSTIEKLILNLFRFAESHPDPERWLKSAVEPYRSGSANDAWRRYYQQLIDSTIDSCLRMCDQGTTICEKNYGPEKYLDNFAEVKESLEKIRDAKPAEKGEKIREAIQLWPSLRRQSAADTDPDLKKKASTLYNKGIKETLINTAKDFFYRTPDEMDKDMEACVPVVSELVDLTLEFSGRLREAKKDKNFASFGDVAHYALDVLLHVNDDGSIEYTETANRMAQETKEIIVDEYQDTNRLQEALLQALSAERFGRPDVFMVGDVKQSIYAFRLACPDLFLQKYNAYGKNDGGTRIIFDANYRSRQEVIDFSNFIFEQIMIPDVGGIDYTDGNQLTAARTDAAANVPFDAAPEIIMIEGTKKDTLYAEGYEIARKIEELTRDGAFHYRDIAILGRHADHPEIERVLADRHIPIIKSSGKGFFDNLEIKLALNLMRIVDNPYQDIPFTAVLTSPVIGLSANDLARIKTHFTGEKFSMFEGCQSFESEPDGEKICSFLEKLSVWREKSEYLGIVHFIEYLLDDSGLYNIIAAMPQGESRRANIDLLKSLAVGFSKGAYTGLFNFIRYIDEIQANDLEIGQAQIPSADLDAVRKMTIHKSKGLEFPVVILIDTGKQHNEKDVREPVVLDADLGIGIEYRNIQEKTKQKTILWKTIWEKKKRELYAEEIRLLYVAMTRARDKLVITGGQMSKSVRESWEKALQDPEPATPLTSEVIMKDKSYLSLLGESMTHSGYNGFRWNFQDIPQEEEKRADELLRMMEKKQALLGMLEEPSDLPESLTAMFDYRYPFEEATHTQVKKTASQLDQEPVDQTFEEEPPEFNSYEEQAMQKGSERGTAYHKVFELLDLGNPDVAGQIEQFTADGHLSEEQKAYVKVEDIAGFLASALGQRMKKAQENGTLRREQQFVMGVTENGELRLIQGIIDAFFEEDGEIVLLDYKTDRRKDEAYFTSNYINQQAAYKQAIEAATGKRVKEAYLYSTELRKEILLEI